MGYLIMYGAVYQRSDNIKLFWQGHVLNLAAHIWFFFLYKNWNLWQWYDSQDEGQFVALTTITFLFFSNVFGLNVFFAQISKNKKMLKKPGKPDWQMETIEISMLCTTSFLGNRGRTC